MRFSTAAHAATAGSPDQVESAKRRPGDRLLIVDDEHPITAALRDYFSILGYVVDVAESKGAALAVLDEHEYAAVVTDLRLSVDLRLEGLDVIRHVRLRRPRAACIVLTACGDADNEAEARQCGADALMQKPAPLGELAERLARLLEQYQLKP